MKTMIFCLLALCGYVTWVIINDLTINKHTCQWELCPYKNVTDSEAKHAVIEYTGQYNTDAYNIDMLHIQYPTLDADQLDSLLSIQITP